MSTHFTVGSQLWDELLHPLLLFLSFQPIFRADASWTQATRLAENLLVWNCVIIGFPHYWAPDASESQGMRQIARTGVFRSLNNFFVLIVLDMGWDHLVWRLRRLAQRVWSNLSMLSWTGIESPQHWLVEILIGILRRRGLSHAVSLMRIVVHRLVYVTETSLKSKVLVVRAKIIIKPST